MSKIKDLTKFTTEQMRDFLGSFDVVMTDNDGVVWDIDKPFEGVIGSLKMLQKMGKDIYMVTNNSLRSLQDYHELFRRNGWDISVDHIISPCTVIIWYLKKINFRGEVFAIASDAFCDMLKEAGIQLTKNPTLLLNNQRQFAKELLDRPSVKAVIIDFDLNNNWSKLALATSCLRREEVLFISGATDTWIGNNDIKILGPGAMEKILSDISGRRSIPCAKPSQLLKDYILKTYNVNEPQRCLFIGDTLHHDMKFASLCGFQKLLVGTGCNTLDEAEMEKEEDIRPDYYISSLGQLFSTFKDLPA